MNDEDRKFVEAVHQLGDTTHYMGVPISDLPGLPAKLMVAEFRAEKAEAEFKNFHRMLCERFGYGHDERHWKRDQVSLIEDIAAALTAERQRAEAQNDKLREALAMYRKAVVIFDDINDGKCFIGSDDRALERAWKAERAALDETEGNGE